MVLKFFLSNKVQKFSHAFNTFMYNTKGAQGVDFIDIFSQVLCVYRTRSFFYQIAIDVQF